MLYKGSLGKGRSPHQQDHDSSILGEGFIEEAIETESSDLLQHLVSSRGSTIKLLTPSETVSSVDTIFPTPKKSRKKIIPKDRQLKKIVSKLRQDERQRNIKINNTITDIININNDRFDWLENLVKIDFALQRSDKSNYLEDNLKNIFETLVAYRNEISSQKDLINHEDVDYYGRLFDNIIGIIKDTQEPQVSYEKWEYKNEIFKKQTWIHKNNILEKHTIGVQQGAEICISIYKIDTTNKEFTLAEETTSISTFQKIEDLIKIDNGISSSYSNEYFNNNIQYIFETLIEYQNTLESEEDKIYYHKLYDTIIQIIKNLELSDVPHKNWKYQDTTIEKHIIDRDHKQTYSYLVDLETRQLNLKVTDFRLGGSKFIDYKGDNSGAGGKHYEHRYYDYPLNNDELLKIAGC